MTTTREQFNQRLAELPAPWLSRRDMERLAGVSAKTLRNWITECPIPEEESRTGPRGAQLVAREAAVRYVSTRLFRDVETAETRPGPRLSPEPTTMPAVPGERWRWTDIARLRGVTPGAASNLGKAYAMHATHPFPSAGDDRTRDAGEVAEWFLWYDSTRPGYAQRGEKRQSEDAPTGRVAEVAGMLREALTGTAELTVESVASALDISEGTAAHYVSQAVNTVAPEAGLIPRAQIADLEPGAVPQSLARRRERVKTLLRRKAAPQPVITVGSTDYYRRSDVESFLRGTS